MNEFDIKAAEWDKNQMHWDRSAAIASEIKRIIPLKAEYSAMEYGAGTGILSMMLKDDLRDILLIDNSGEMIKQSEERIRDTGSKNMRARIFDLEHNDLPGESFDLIFTQMVLHHVTNVQSIFRRFSGLLNPGGYLAVADLYEEDGSFHGDGFTGHKGFNPLKLGEALSELGFTDISDRKCFVINRKTTDSQTKQFDVFLLTARKKV